MVGSPLTSGDEDRTGRRACLNWGDATLLSSHADRSASVLRAAQRELATRAPSTGANPQHRAACHQPTQPDIEAEHWHRIRHSNLIERTFGETRRRTKVIGRLPGERSCLSLVWAVLDRASRGWRGLTMTPRALRLVQDLRRQLLHPPAEEVIDEAVTAAA
jgi:transposase-like protein